MRPLPEGFWLRPGAALVYLIVLLAGMALQSALLRITSAKNCLMPAEATIFSEIVSQTRLHLSLQNDTDHEECTSSGYVGSPQSLPMSILLHNHARTMAHNTSQHACAMIDFQPWLERKMDTWQQELGKISIEVASLRAEHRS